MNYNRLATINFTSGVRMFPIKNTTGKLGFGYDVKADMCRERANFRLRIGLSSIFSGLCFETALFISDDDVAMSSSP